MNDNCIDCPLRLFNPRGHKIEGVGTPAFGNIIVIPYVDKKAYKFNNLRFEDMVKQICDMVHSSTGELLLNYCYITPFIKCRQTSRCIVDDDIGKRCFNILKEEFKQYNPTKILLLGSDVTKYFLQYSINPNKVYVDIMNRYWFNNYHPGVCNYDQNKAKEFSDGLIKWFNAIRNNEFYNYET